MVRVTVRDDGDGFDTTTTTHGFGLLGMRERAELFGVALELESAIGKGTTISVAFPARRRDQARVA